MEMDIYINLARASKFLTDSELHEVLPEPIEVTMLNGESSTWRITRNLGNPYQPLWKGHPDQESVKLIDNNPLLKAGLTSMLLSEVSDNATVSLKDGEFGVLYFRHFDCNESDLGSNMAAPSRGRVIRRIQADILSEISLTPRFHRGIDIAIPPPSSESANQVALWIFVPHSVFASSNGNWDILEDVISLLME